jgi:hypothetical protein
MAALLGRQITPMATEGQAGQQDGARAVIWVAVS